MLRHLVAAIVAATSAACAADISGRWDFTHADDRFRGTVVLRQSGSSLAGTWHTSTGKKEADTPIAGRIDNSTVTLTRSIGDARQVYVLTLSKDGRRLDGFGEGFFLSHTNLNMQRRAVISSTKKPERSAAPTEDGPLAAAEVSLSGTWTFTHDNGRFEGIIMLGEDGPELAGTWHTTTGKSERDTSVAGRIDGRTVRLTRFIGTARQDYVLTLYGGDRLYRFGEGFFLNYTVLDMQRLFR